MSFKEFLNEAKASNNVTVQGTFEFKQIGGPGEKKAGLDFSVTVYRTGAGKFDSITLHPTDRNYYNYLKIGRGMHTEIKAKNFEHFLHSGHVEVLVLPSNDTNLKDGDAGAYSFQFDKHALAQIKDAAGDTSNNTSVRAPQGPRALKGIETGVKVESDTRAIVTCDNDTADKIKKEVHDSKSKIGVRVMARKEGSKVYIDTADKTGLDKALAQVNKILDK
jgi:hypothetical protein